ncbi:hypothetical protein [Luteolibacter soli]|uniref:hypothetical protein n=1 Tax=Luteolibacter soli TaxID=3135280 RepID=UPI0031199C53
MMKLPSPIMLKPMALGTVEEKNAPTKSDATASRQDPNNGKTITTIDSRKNCSVR